MPDRWVHTFETHLWGHFLVQKTKRPKHTIIAWGNPGGMHFRAAYDPKAESTKSALQLGTRALHVFTFMNETFGDHLKHTQI